MHCKLHWRCVRVCCPKNVNLCQRALFTMQWPPLPNAPCAYCFCAQQQQYVQIRLGYTQCINSTAIPGWGTEDNVGALNSLPLSTNHFQNATCSCNSNLSSTTQ
jgi:hypothetical protein